LAFDPRWCAQCGTEVHIPFESKAAPFCPVSKMPIEHPTRSYPFQHSSGQSVWLTIVLILLVEAGIAWFLGKKGFLGGDEADHASSANASLMHLRKAMRLADAGSQADSEVEFAQAITLATAPGSEAWRAVSDLQAAHLMRGEARFARGDSRAAEEDFSKAIVLTGTQPGSDGLSVGDVNEHKFLAFLDRALAKTQRADLGGARSDLTSALAAIPDYSQQRLQWLRAKINSPSQSSGAWLEYLEQQGKRDGYYYLVRGEHKMSQRDYSAAITDFTESMQRSYDIALSLQHRGACKLFLGDQSGAQADFKQANELRQNPGMIFFFRAVLRQLDGDYQGAAADYSEVIRLDPKPLKGPPGRRSPISTIYSYHNEWFVAGASKLQLGDVEANLAAVHFNLALCYERLGRIREAKEELEQVLQKQANFAKAQDRLARLNGNAIKPHP
jgi:tetratricopeptide (TPR) repeat protein